MVLRNVQALRAIAAVLVVMVHLDVYETRYVSPELNLASVFRVGGHFGVDLFFVISGFIMVTTTWNQFAQPRASSRFLVRRLIRIYPPYWFALLPILALAITHPGLVDSHSRQHADLLASFLLLPGPGLLIVSWTLVFEMYFYLVFTVALRFSRPVAAGVVALWVVAIVVMSQTVRGYGAYASFFRDPLALEFVLGMLVAIAVRRGRFVAPLAFVVTGICWLVGTVVLMHHGYGRPSISWWRIFGAAAPWALVLYGTIGLERGKGIVLPRAMDALGDASYALYLWHIPVMSAVGLLIVRLHAHGLAAHVVLDVLMLASAIAASLLIYRFVERPMTVALNARFATHAESRRFPLTSVKTPAA